jgi:hypothetical protein
MTLRRIEMVVGGTPVGRAKTFPYPITDHKVYEIPTYSLRVVGRNASGGLDSRVFEVIRFGVNRKVDGAAPKVVGLADAQAYTIQAWLPTYSVHSAASTEMGAWHVFDNYLIHDGPDDPLRQLYATAGCIEICGGPFGFDRFNDYLMALSGSTKPTRDEKLAEMGRSRIMKITYEAAPRPPLREWPGP